MTDALAISGDYADLKLVKTRSVMQIVVECPIEEGERIVRMFGVPQPGKPVKLALARIAENTAPISAPKAEKERKSFDELPASQQAAMLGKDPRFQKFLRESRMAGFQPYSELSGEEYASSITRHLCGVFSRADLDDDDVARDRWQRLRSEYEAWKRL